MQLSVYQLPILIIRIRSDQASRLYHFPRAPLKAFPKVYCLGGILFFLNHLLFTRIECFKIFKRNMKEKKMAALLDYDF